MPDSHDRLNSSTAGSSFEFNENTFSALSKNGFDLNLVISLNGKPKYVSPLAQIILGYSNEEISQTSFYDFLHPDDRPLMERALSQLQESKPLHLAALRIQALNDQWLWMELNISNHLQTEGINGLIITLRDVSEEIQIRHHLNEIKERSEQLTRLTSDALWEFNGKDNTISFSQGLEEKLGYREDKAHSNPDWWKNKLHPEDRETIMLELFGAADNPEITNLNFKYRFLHGNGKYLHIQNRVHIVRNGSGKVKKMLGSMQDITRSEKHIESIQQQNTLLREASWDQSHEVRAPLSTMLGLIDIIRSNETPDQTKSEALEYLERSAMELDQMVRSVIRRVEIMRKRLPQ